MSNNGTPSAIIEKTLELCQTIVDQPEFKDLRRRVDAFMADEDAKLADPVFGGTDYYTASIGQFQDQLYPNSAALPLLPRKFRILTPSAMPSLRIPSPKASSMPNRKFTTCANR